MLIKLTNLFCLLGFSAPFILSSRGYAGAGSSGGAKVVVCKSSDENRGNVELLDLYEARKNGGQIRTAQGPLKLNSQSIFVF